MAADSTSAARPKRSRAKLVRPGRLPVSEFAFDRAGAGSPFGDDVALPISADELAYEHPQPQP